MKDYKEFTFGWMIFVFAVPIHLLLTYIYIREIGDMTMDTTGFLVITLTFILIYLLFYGMTTKISSEAITITYGIGIIRKRIQLKRIKTVGTVKSPWYYGWGIRIFPSGTLYNISGNDCVELKFKDKDRFLRIGTRDSLTLKKEIEKRLV